LGDCHLIVRDRIYDIRRGNDYERLIYDDIHMVLDTIHSYLASGMSQRG
jgi:hypothetical protein